MITGFVYKWTNTVNGMWYIGSRKGTIDDGYIGSGKYFLQAVEKYGIESFTREILFEGDHEKDQIRSNVEAKYLREENAANNPMSYNQTNMTGPNCFDKETRLKMSTSAKYRAPMSQETRDKISVANKGQTNGPLGKQHRQKISIALSGRKLSAEHTANISSGNKGKIRTKEARQHISDGLTGRILTNEHRANVSRGKKGKPQDREHSRKIGDALRGKIQQIIVCPHCKKSGGISVMKRWHLNNCREK